jgi:glutamate---cysteine ligase / carboxylate-amine ligase
LAARDGLDGMIIVSEEGKRRKISDDILNLLEHLSPVAKSLNSHDELMRLETIIKDGSNAKRQRSVHRAKGNLEAVVDSLVKELETDVARS